MSPDLIERSRRLGDLAERRLAVLGPSPAARERARRLRDHIEGFVAPRAADVDAAVLVLLLGPTGAGKSSLMNAIAGADVSATGVLRPTTRNAIVLATEADAGALRSGRLRRVAPDRLQTVVAPRADGVVVIDAPDVDSVERDNRELAEVLLEACDLCVFVTTATRYADLVPHDILRRVRERGVPLVVVLNRVPPDERDSDIVVADATRLLARAGVGATASPDLIVVHEGEVDAQHRSIAAPSVEPLLRRIETLRETADERRRLAREALAGAVRGLVPLVHAVADDLDHDAIDAEALRRIAASAFDGEADELRNELRSGVLLHTEVLSRWHDYVGTDQITRYISSGMGKLRGLIATALRGTPPAPVAAVEAEMTTTVEALALRHASEASRRVASEWSERGPVAALIERDPTLWSVSAAFAPALREGLRRWMGSIIDDVRTGGGRKRAVAQVAALGVNVVGVAVMLAVFAHTAGLTGAEFGVAAGTAFVNQKLLEAIFGERAMEELITRARTRLDELLSSLFAAERARFEALVPASADLRALAADLRDAVAGLTL